MIKKIDEAHIEECVKVIKESFSTVAKEFGITEENAPRYTAFATTKKRLNWHMFEEKRPMYAFFDGEKIVGYYSLLLKDTDECELNNLCVLPEYRHKGIGEKLIVHAFLIARNYDCVKMNISIVEENKPLKNWYESFGFIHTHSQKFDFFPFTSGYMVKEL